METQTEYKKHAYDHELAASHYEKRPYYRGLMGRVRRYRERAAVHSAVQQFMRDSVILDCPCGNGRWFDRLSSRADRIVAIDISNAMLEAAERRRPRMELVVRKGDAEQLDLEDKSVDHVFSYALMKHLPPAVKIRVLKEFARVSTGRMAVSFAIFNRLGFWRWRLKGGGGHPIRPAELESLASEASLRVGASYKVGLPLIGMETLVVLERIPI